MNVAHVLKGQLRSAKVKTVHRGGGGHTYGSHSVTGHSDSASFLKKKYNELIQILT